MTGKLLKLPERLMTIAGFIKHGSRVADVGTDHGYLPVYLAQSGLAVSIIASDISAGSLKSARASASKYSVYDKIAFIVAPGLAGIGASDADTVVMSGMGGETILLILADAPWTKLPAVSIILQPQTKTDRLCSWLRENGYAIADARLTLDKGKFYVVMLVRGVETGDGDERLGVSDHVSPEMELLSMLAEKGDPLFSRYVDKLLSRTLRAAEGMERAGADDYSVMAKRLEDLKRLREIM